MKTKKQQNQKSNRKSKTYLDCTVNEVILITVINTVFDSNCKYERTENGLWVYSPKGQIMSFISNCELEILSQYEFCGVGGFGK